MKHTWQRVLTHKGIACPEFISGINVFSASLPTGRQVCVFAMKNFKS